MAKHARISCPACQATLRIRPDCLGMTVSCKLCGEIFVANLPDVLPSVVAAHIGDTPVANREVHAEAEIRGLLERLASRKRRYEVKKQLLAESEARVASLSAELEDLRARVVAVDGDARSVAEMTARAESAEAMAEALRADAARERDALALELQAARSEAERLSVELSEARAEAADFRASREVAAGDLAEARAVAGRLGAESDLLRAELAGLTESRDLVDRREEELELAKSELADARRQAEERGRLLAEERDRAARAVADLQARVDAAGVQAEEFQAVAAREHETLSVELRTARDEVECLSAQLAGARAESDELRGARERSVGDLIVARAIIGRHEEKLDSVRAELADARRQAEERGRLLAEERDRAAAAMEELEAGRVAQAADVERRLQEARDQAQAERSLREDEIKAFRADLEQVRSDIAGSLGSRDAALRLMEALTAERDQVTALRDQLKGTFRDGEVLYQAKLKQAGQAIQQANQAHAAERKRADELVGRLRGMQAELERQQREREAERLQAHRLVLALQQGQNPPSPDTAEHAQGPRRVALIGKPEGPRAPRVVALPIEAGTDGSHAMDHRDLALGELGSLPIFRK